MSEYSTALCIMHGLIQIKVSYTCTYRYRQNKLESKEFIVLQSASL